MPRPPPSRAITGCCTCAPRPTPNRRSSRPPASISTSISSASLPSSPAHPIHLSPPHSQPFTTSSTRSASPDVRQHARAPVVLDFLYPGFGFFSRSLPPVVSSASSTNPTVVPGLRPPPSPPPGADATTDFSIYRSQEGREIGSLARSSSHPGQTAASRWMTVARVRPGACVCGRVRETCLRCRASSTAASIASGRSAGGVTASRTDKGKRKEVVENDSPLGEFDPPAQVLFFPFLTPLCVDATQKHPRLPLRLLRALRPGLQPTPLSNFVPFSNPSIHLCLRLARLHSPRLSTRPRQSRPLVADSLGNVRTSQSRPRTVCLSALRSSDCRPACETFESGTG